MEKLFEGQFPFDGQDRVEPTLGLTPLQLEVFESTYNGMTPQQIAQERCRSVNTIKEHLAKALSVLGADNFDQAIDIASKLMEQQKWPFTVKPIPTGCLPFHLLTKVQWSVYSGKGGKIINL